MPERTKLSSPARVCGGGGIRGTTTDAPESPFMRR